MKELVLALVFLGSSINYQARAQEPQSTTALTADAFAKAWTEAWNSHDVDRILTYYTDDAFFEDVPSVENGWDVPLRGHQMMRESLVKTFEEMPDLEFEVRSASQMGDRMVVEWSMTGSRYRDFTGSFSTRAVSILERKGDKIAWERDYYDMYRTLVELGMVPALDPEQSMDNRQKVAERNKRLVLRMNDVIWNKGDVDRFGEFVSPDCVRHFLPDGSELRGIDSLLEEVREHREAFPDWGEHIQHVVAEGDLVAIHFVSTGTNEGSWLGEPPTGRRIRIHEMSIFRIEDGKIVEQWLLPDIGSLQRQLSGQE